LLLYSIALEMPFDFKAVAFLIKYYSSRVDATRAIHEYIKTLSATEVGGEEVEEMLRYHKANSMAVTLPDACPKATILYLQ
jgi:hypothetical protein